MNQQQLLHQQIMQQQLFQQQHQQLQHGQHLLRQLDRPGNPPVDVSGVVGRIIEITICL